MKFENIKCSHILIRQQIFAVIKTEDNNIKRSKATFVKV